MLQNQSNDLTTDATATADIVTTTDIMATTDVADTPQFSVTPSLSVLFDDLSDVTNNYGAVITPGKVATSFLSVM